MPTLKVGDYFRHHVTPPTVFYWKVLAISGEYYHIETFTSRGSIKVSQYSISSIDNDFQKGQLLPLSHTIVSHLNTSHRSIEIDT